MAANRLQIIRCRAALVAMALLEWREDMLNASTAIERAEALAVVRVFTQELNELLDEEKQLVISSN